MEIPQELLNNPVPRPVFAEMKNTHEKYSVFTLNLFDKQVEQVTTGESHYNVAARSVEQWNDHFDREWSTVRASMARVLEDFIRGLKAVGVEAQVIEAAIESTLDEMVKNVNVRS
jgi:hypothetical protein